MPTQRSLRQQTFTIVLILLVALILTWGNVNFTRQHPGGNDFLTRWVGTRALILEGITPYSNIVAERIQIKAYGRPASPHEDQMRMVYPIYSALIFAPFALIPDYTYARAIWMTTLEILLIILLKLSLRLVHWQPSAPLLATWLLFSLTWYHGVRPLINGNAVIWVAFFLTIAAWALTQHHDRHAGMWLALATIKPHLALLPILFTYGWAWTQRRWAIIKWTTGVLITLTLVGMLFVPQWLIQDLQEILSYPSYTPPTTLQTALQIWFPSIGTYLGISITFLLAGWLLWVWKQAWKQNHFPLEAYAFTLAISQWIGIPTDPGNFILLFLPLVWLTKRLNKNEKGDIVVLGILIILWCGLWWLFFTTLIPTSGAPQQNPVMFLPLPAMLLSGFLAFGIFSPSSTRDTKFPH